MCSTPAPLEINYKKYCKVSRKQHTYVWDAARDERLARAWRGVKLEECILEVLVDLHDRCLVATAVAVVGRREDGDDVALLRPVEAVHDELVRSRNERQPVVMVERLADVLPERCLLYTSDAADE